MSRTTPELVGQHVDLDGSIDPDPFIDLANRLTTVVCGNVGHDDDTLEMIERLLAAHFYSRHRDKQIVSENIGGEIVTTYQAKRGTDQGLAATEYGEDAMLCDTSGKLAEYNARILNPPNKGVVPMMGGIHLGREAWPHYRT